MDAASLALQALHSEDRNWRFGSLHRRMHIALLSPIKITLAELCDHTRSENENRLMSDCQPLLVEGGVQFSKTHQRAAIPASPTQNVPSAAFVQAAGAGLVAWFTKI